jgi:hypothetical protein
VEAARQPLEKQAAAIKQLPPASRDRDRIVSSLILIRPELFLGYVREAAVVRCGVAGIACERFRQAHRRWPDELTELVPAYLQNVPLDPFGGQPLGYTKSEDGVSVYSVGRRPPRQATQGADSVFKPSWLPEGVELGFRLWNPDQRRLPPLPEPTEREPMP